MASEFDFTDEEIREELANLGYYDVPKEKLEDFKKDLLKLISLEKSKSSSLNCSSITDADSREDRITHSPVYDIEAVQEDNFTNHGSQWLDKEFKEDWHYRGELQKSSRPHTAPSKGTRQTNLKLVHEHKTAFPSAIHERNQSCDTDSESGKRCMKRKTSRKTSDGCRTVDESFTTDTDSETAGIYEIYERIKKLAMRECECGKTRPKSGDVEPPYRIKGKPNKCPSVIKVTKGHPHTRNLERTDRNARLKMYEKHWKAQPAVGEDHRHALRKSIRAKLMHHFDVQLPQKVFVPNLYIPPHEKNRVALRWEIRKACKNYELPKHGFYHEV